MHVLCVYVCIYVFMCLSVYKQSAQITIRVMSNHAYL